MQKLIKSLDEMNRFASSLVKDLPKVKAKAAYVIGLEGDLGSGKTTFTQGAAKALKIKQSITSPTFVLEKIYKIGLPGRFKRLIHIDCYRFRKPDEVLTIGWEDIINDPENLILVEWPELIGNYLPEQARLIKFEFVDENTRKLTF